MKVLHLSTYDTRGGASIAAYELHRHMVRAGIDSQMMVLASGSGDSLVRQSPLLARALQRVAISISKPLLQLQKKTNRLIHSLNVFPTGIHRAINDLDVDIVQLHWVNMNMISIGEIARLNRPVIWKMHDMWPFSGAEHYTLPDEKERFSTGYTRHNRQPGAAGFDLDRLVWKYKKKRWQKADFELIAGSRWMAESAAKSQLFKDRRITTINNLIDTSVFAPAQRKQARAPSSRPVILAGAWFAEQDIRKGLDKLREMFELLHREDMRVELRVFGTSESRVARSDLRLLHNALQTTFLGDLDHGPPLRDAYREADVFVMPSLVEAFGMTAAEAMACGTPVVCFDTSGLKDIVDHKVNGYRARCFDPEDLAAGVRWVLSQDRELLAREARAKAVRAFNPDKTVREYVYAYERRLTDR